MQLAGRFFYGAAERPLPPGLPSARLYQPRTWEFPRGRFSPVGPIDQTVSLTARPRSSFSVPASPASL